ncbi:hypothetical protein AB0I94_12310 [Streptomyces sp. NPDC050147]|uniref:hypothetical protein n=1 Tax=Streptomyces sp. NPDC050147 TaxID=3155513 RepID=UPI0034398223
MDPFAFTEERPQKPASPPVKHAPEPEPKKAEKMQEKMTRKLPRAAQKSEWETAILFCMDPELKSHLLPTAFAVARLNDWTTGKPGKKSNGHRQSVYAAAAKKGSVRALSTDLKNLCELGWLFQYSTNRGEGNPDLYWLTIPDHDHSHTFDDVWHKSEEIESRRRG